MKIITQLSDSNFNYICHSLPQKKIPYISVSQFKEDYQEQKVYVLEEKGKPVAMCSLVWSDKHQNFAIKRMICFKKANAGKGYANKLVAFISNLEKAPVCCTPWLDNFSMRRILEKNGFQLKYIFSQHWCFYEKLAN